MTKLAYQIKARNLVNTYAIELYALMAAHFRPFVGEPVLTEAEQFFAKVKKNLPTFERSGLWWYFSISRYSASITLRMDIFDGEGKMIQESQDIYLLDLDGGNLTKIYDSIPHKNDFTEAGVLADLEKLKQAEEALRQVRRELGPFAPTAKVIG